MSVPTISKSILTDRNTVYTEQSVIELVISPEEVPMLNTSQGTYLKFLLEIDADANATNCIAQPDPMSGGTAVIQTISIYSNNGKLLEQLEDAPVLTEVQSVEILRITDELKRCIAKIKLHGYFSRE